MKRFGQAIDEMMRVPQRIAWIIAGVIVLLGLALSSIGPVGVPFLVATVVALFVASSLPVAILPRSDREIASLFLFILRDQHERWTRLSPDEPIPADGAESRRWMSKHPVDLDNRDSISFHGAFLLRLRNYDEAENLTGRMPDETPYQRFDRAITFAQVEFERGGDGDLAESRRLMQEIPEGADRERAVRDYAYEETERELTLGGDWQAPLVALKSPQASTGIRSIATLGVARLGWVTPRFILGWVVGLIIFGVATGNVDVL